MDLSNVVGVGCVHKTIIHGTVYQAIDAWLGDKKKDTTTQPSC